MSVYSFSYIQWNFFTFLPLETFLCPQHNILLGKPESVLLQFWGGMTLYSFCQKLYVQQLFQKFLLEKHSQHDNGFFHGNVICGWPKNSLNLRFLHIKSQLKWWYEQRENLIMFELLVRLRQRNIYHFSKPWIIYSYQATVFSLTARADL